jgi:hypothetical protein
MDQVRLYEYKDFRSSLNALYKRGGHFQKAAESVFQIQSKATSGFNPFEGLRHTKHGESRLRNCVKYDLAAAARLITVQKSGYCILLYCSDHEDCDRWLKTHAGLEPVVDENCQVVITHVSGLGADEPRVEGGRGHSVGALYLLLGDALFERLVAGLPRRLVRRLEGLECTFSDSEVWTIVAEVETPDHRLAISDVFLLLRQDKAKEAIQRAKLYLGESMPLEEWPERDLPDVVDSDVIRRIDPTSPVYGEALKRFMESSRYRDWMLFMHPAQEEIASEEMRGPSKLTGVSGSGKTCVVVQRAVQLARRYPTERVLILTLNKALARLIEQLVETCANEKEVRRITVRSFFTLCRELITAFEPHNTKLYDEVTWKTNEHIDEIWQEFYRCELNNYDAQVLQPVHDTLLAQGWNPEKYIRDEFDWIRSALPSQGRARYLEMERSGRSVRLPKPLREMVLQGLEGWEQKMRDIGTIDALGAAHAVVRHAHRLKPMYRCILIDEGQDFGNIELEIISKLVTPADDDIFLCGDAAQAVTTKYQSLKSIGISIPGARSYELFLNYRNSRDVLEAAYQVLYSNLSDELIDREDFRILDPKYSSFSGSTPLILSAEDLASEIAYAIHFCKGLLSDKPMRKACIAVCGFSLYELGKFGDSVGIPVLDGRTDIDSGSLFLSDLEQTKGFEFDVVCVLNCVRGILPASSAPESERHRDLARFYVAMTRAKTDLVLSWSGQLSPFLSGCETYFLSSEWSAYVTTKPESCGAPRLLAQYRAEAAENRKWRKMTGPQFLYTPAALGLDPELISKMRLLIDGQPMRKARETIRWGSLGTAVRDYRKSAKVRALWGPSVGKRFEQLIETLEGSAGCEYTIQEPHDHHGVGTRI